MSAKSMNFVKIFLIERKTDPNSVQNLPYQELKKEGFPDLVSEHRCPGPI